METERQYGAVPADRDWGEDRWKNDCFELEGLIRIVYPQIYRTHQDEYELWENDPERVALAKVGIERIYSRYRPPLSDLGGLVNEVERMKEAVLAIDPHALDDDGD